MTLPFPVDQLRGFLHPLRKSYKTRRTLARHSYCVNAGTATERRCLSGSIQDGTVCGCDRKTIYVIAGDTLCHSGIPVGTLKHSFSDSYGIKDNGQTRAVTTAGYKQWRVRALARTAILETH